MRIINFWWSVLVFALTFTVMAADNFATLVPENAAGAVCIYPQQFFATEWGKKTYAKLQADGKFGEVERLATATGIDLQKDFNRAVIVIVEANDAGTYVIGEGKFDLAKIEAYLVEKQLKDFTVGNRNGIKEFRWSIGDQDNLKIILAAASADKLIFSRSEALIDAGLAMLRGEGKNAVGTPLFAETGSRETMLFIEGGLAPDKLSGMFVPNAENVNGVNLTVGQQADKKICANIILDMKTAEAATQFSQELAGLKMMLCMRAPTLSALSIKPQDNLLQLNLALSENDLASLESSLCEPDDIEVEEGVETEE